MTGPTPIAKLAACAAGLNIAFGALSYVTLTIGVLVDGYAFSLERAAMLGTLELGAMALTSLALTPIAASLNLGRVAFWGALLSAFGNLATSFVDGFAAVVLFRLIAGLGAGIVAPVVNVAIASGRQPVKLYANAMIAFMILSAGFYLVVPLIYGAYSFPAYFLAYGGMFLITAPLLRNLGLAPGKQKIPAASQSISYGESYPLIPAAFTGAGAFLIWLGYSVVWSFCERIAASLGMSPEAIGRVFSLALIIGLVGTFIAARLGERFGLTRPAIVGGLGMGLAFLAITFAPNPQLYTISMYGWGVVLLFFMPYLIGFCAHIDVSGRLAAAVSGLMPVASALGPVVGGLILARWTYEALGFFGVGCAIACCLCVACADLFRRKPDAEVAKDTRPAGPDS